MKIWKIEFPIDKNYSHWENQETRIIPSSIKNPTSVRDNFLDIFSSPYPVKQWEGRTGISFICFNTNMRNTFLCYAVVSLFVLIFVFLCGSLTTEKNQVNLIFRRKWVVFHLRSFLPMFTNKQNLQYYECWLIYEIRKKKYEPTISRPKRISLHRLGNFNLHIVFFRKCLEFGTSVYIKKNKINTWLNIRSLSEIK